MFRMEFQTLTAVTEEDDEFSRPFRKDVGRGKDVYENYSHRTVKSRVSPSRMYEGRVGKHGTKEILHTGADLPKILTHRLSSAATLEDLIDFGSPIEQAAVDQEVLRELVKPFAESVNRIQSLDTDVFVTFLEFQPGQQDLLSGNVDFESFRNVESLPVRSNSYRSMRWSDLSDAEGNFNYYGDRVHVKDEDKGSPAGRAYNRAFNKLMHKKNKPAVSDSKVAKPWEEPLLAGHEQSKLERKLQKEAKLEAKRQAEQAKRDAEMQKRELLDLANPIPESALRNQKEQYNMRKGIHKLFQISGSIHSSGHSPKEGDTRDSKLMLQRGGMFETCMSPSATDVALSHIRSGSRPTTRRDIHFDTVESNQRDVKAWAMEEYLAKNSRISDYSAKKDEEELGGIEGNQLLNRYFDDDVTNNVDSDSD